MLSPSDGDGYRSVIGIRLPVGQTEKEKTTSRQQGLEPVSSLVTPFRIRECTEVKKYYEDLKK